MKRDELDTLIDQARLRPLSSEEERRLNAILQTDPSAWPDQEGDKALTRLLGTTSDAPLSSNFSSQVMQAIELAERRRSSSHQRLFRLPEWIHGWSVRFGIASCVALLFMLGWFQRGQSERKQIAESVATISEVASVPSVEVLKDFDAIQSLGTVPPAEEVEADLTLLAALE